MTTRLSSFRTPPATLTRLAFEVRVIAMVAWDSVSISARHNHRVVLTTLDQPTNWLAVFYGG